MKKQFRDFETAREFVRSLGLKSLKYWMIYCKSGNKPDDIPTNLDQFYKNKGWNGWGDFLGTGNVAPKDMEFRSFAEAREFVSSLNLKGVSEWEVYCKSSNKPDNIPSHPNGTYKNKGWQNWGNWLGTGRIADQDKVYRSFAEARKFAISLGLKTGDEWKEYCKSGNKPDDIPYKPARTYKNEWKGMGDWTGTGRISNSNKQYRPYKEAREFVQKLGLKTQKEWREYCKSGDKPDNIPTNPWNVYKEWNKK